MPLFFLNSSGHKMLLFQLLQLLDLFHKFYLQFFVSERVQERHFMLSINFLIKHPKIYIGSTFNKTV